MKRDGSNTIALIRPVKKIAMTMEYVIKANAFVNLSSLVFFANYPLARRTVMEKVFAHQKGFANAYRDSEDHPAMSLICSTET